MSQQYVSPFSEKVANVLLQRVLTNYTRPDLDRVVEQIVGMV